jgi:antirestriction protein ArdC
MAKKEWVKPADYVKKDVRQEATDRIIAEFEKGPGAWQQTWSKSSGFPMNALTGNPYRGTNFLLLTFAGYPDNRFVTFEQTKSIKSVNAPDGSKQGDPLWSCHVKKWERGISITRMVDKKTTKTDAQGNEEEDFVKVMKCYTVFNAAQIEGMPPQPELVRNKDFTNFERGEMMIQALVKKTGLTVEEGGDKAFYNQVDDKVQMPPRATFTDESHFYTVFMHEGAHSTLHASRLNRKEVQGDFTHEARASEELTAELASVMLAAETGIPLSQEHVRNSGAYLKSWIKALKDDKTEIFKACSAAHKICDYMVAKEAEYAKDLGIEIPAPVFAKPAAVDTRDITRTPAPVAKPSVGTASAAQSPASLARPRETPRRSAQTVGLSM